MMRLSKNDLEKHKELTNQIRNKKRRIKYYKRHNPKNVEYINYLQIGLDTLKKRRESLLKACKEKSIKDRERFYADTFYRKVREYKCGFCHKMNRHAYICKECMDLFTKKKQVKHEPNQMSKVQA